MSMLGKLIDGLRERRAGQEQAASTSYGQLVLRLMHDRPAKADTPEVVDDLLRQAGLGPDDLAADVERAQTHYQLRKRCRAVTSARQAAHDADERWLDAARRAQVEALRLQREAQALHFGAQAAGSQVQAAEAELARVAAAAPGDLAGAYREADARWRAALAALGDARQLARQGWEDRAEHLAGAFEELEREAAACRASLDRALAALLAHEPTPEALRPAAAALVGSAS